MVYKYEIVETLPNWYSILKYNKWWIFKWKSWVKDYQGFRESWPTYNSCLIALETIIDTDKHITKVVKTVEVE